VLWAVGIVIVLQSIFTYAPFMQTFFVSQSLSMLQGLQVLAFGIVAVVLLECEKVLVRKWQ
jgi:hypothetical protein